MPACSIADILSGSGSVYPAPRGRAVGRAFDLVPLLFSATDGKMTVWRENAKARMAEVEPYRAKPFVGVW